jgi:hypothetical protein
VHELYFGCQSPNIFHFGLVLQFTADNVHNFEDTHQLVVFSYKYESMFCASFTSFSLLVSKVSPRFVTKEAVAFVSTVHCCEWSLY